MSVYEDIVRDLPSHWLVEAMPTPASFPNGILLVSHNLATKIYKSVGRVQPATRRVHVNEACVFFAIRPVGSSCTYQRSTEKETPTREHLFAELGRPFLQRFVKWMLLCVSTFFYTLVFHCPAISIALGCWIPYTTGKQGNCWLHSVRWQHFCHSLFFKTNSFTTVFCTDVIRKDKGC